MASEIQLAHYATGKNLYAIIRNQTGSVWQTTTNTFVSYTTANIANYDIALTEQGTASRYYAGDFDTDISAGVYNVTVFERAGGSPAEGDVAVGGGHIHWDGSAVIPLSGLAARLLDLTDGVEPGSAGTERTVREALRIILSACAGKVSGAGTTSIAIRDTNDSKDRISATVDANGNRSAVTLIDT